MKAITAWAGVCDDKLEIEFFPDTAEDKYCRLYTTRAQARKVYVEVTKVLIIALE